MSAGTLTLTNNSAAVGGSGTAFATDLTAGDFIVATVGGITYTLPVKSVGSDTSLTLISNYPGPTQSGVAWSAVPRAAQNQITAALVAQTTEALRGLNSDKQNWQAVFSDSGDITVILPDGSSFTGPSWKKISDLLADIDQAGLQQIADQVSANAQQVATDRLDVDAKATQVSGDAATASLAATNAVAANTTAQQAKTDAVAANTAAQQAKTDAQAAAASINPDNLLNRNNNLSDVANAATAVGNLGLKPIGTSGDSIPLLSGSNTWSTQQQFNGNILAGTGLVINSAAYSTAGPTDPGSRGLFSGSDTASFATPSNINIYSWYGIGFCTAYTSPANGIVAGAPAVYINTRNGTINAKGAVQANGVTLTSDWNAKESVKLIDPEDALQKMGALDGYTFRYKEAESDRLTAGVLAQDLDLIIPDLVIRDEGSEYLVADYMGLIGYLVSAVKGLKLKVDDLTAEAAALKSKGS
ncbi:tail fiber domain-containing protein [Kosakonia pseudosacchari]|uniref:tail fiber domain-containing protein n=1 Tax=Kosakonia pseudosacchari TaxID=1646340 RepID=UPI00187F3EAF|nr:tail fiber domain-containing protein [Kosakonia pseudosacchari]QOV65848.1 tail fiber domain-containing protein [Kosakonia pseudosacchari]